MALPFNLDHVPAPARWLGVGGLIPFVVLALTAWSVPAPHHAEAITIQIYYAATILSFLGAVHWGLAMGDPSGDKRWSEVVGWRPLIIGVSPPLLAWIALLIDPIGSIVLLMLGFAAMFYVDAQTVRRGKAPVWYLLLRRVLTPVVLVALAVSLVRLFIKGT